MQWTFREDVPIYLQLIEQMKLKIVSGEYAPGEKLVPVREFAAEVGVNPNTLQRAMAELERVGLVFSLRTSGRYVTEDTAIIAATRRTLAAARAADYLKAMKKLGFSPEEAAELLSREGVQEEI